MFTSPDPNPLLRPLRRNARVSVRAVRPCRPAAAAALSGHQDAAPSTVTVPVGTAAGPLPPNPSLPAHLYVHIPFCPHKCGYCAFVTHIGSLRLVPDYLRALVLDMQQLGQARPRKPLSTLYFGGGTPSMLTADQVAMIVEEARRVFGLEDGAEITLEGHPATVSPALLEGFRAAGVTRVSFGAESLNSDELTAIGRVHSPRQVEEAVRGSRQAGFDSIALDFIYGLPHQSLASWERTLRSAIALGPDHLSLYPLSIEPRTPFARRLSEGQLDVPADDVVVEMYHLACSLLRAHGYQHYEVANWARPDRQCRHNLAYWHNHEFYAVGVGAHGYFDGRRTENVRQTARYISLLAEGESPVVHIEEINDDIERAESVMLRLRLLSEGLDLAEFRERYGMDLVARYGEDIERLCRQGVLCTDGVRLILPEHAVPLANDVWQAFM